MHKVVKHAVDHILKGTIGSVALLTIQLHEALVLVISWIFKELCINYVTDFNSSSGSLKY